MKWEDREIYNMDRSIIVAAIVILFILRKITTNVHNIEIIVQSYANRLSSKKDVDAHS